MRDDDHFDWNRPQTQITVAPEPQPAPLSVAAVAFGYVVAACASVFIIIGTSAADWKLILWAAS